MICNEAMDSNILALPVSKIQLLVGWFVIAFFLPRQFGRQNFYGDQYDPSSSVLMALQR